MKNHFQDALEVTIQTINISNNQVAGCFCVNDNNQSFPGFRTFIPRLAFLLVLISTVVTAHATDIYWTNTAGGNWSVAANWSPNQVPGGFDNVYITNTGNYVVTIDSVINAVHDLTVGGDGGTQQTLQCDTNYLTIHGNALIRSNGIVISSGGNVAGPILLIGQYLWNGGDLGGPLTIASGGVLTLDGSVQKRVLAAGSITNHGVVTWKQGFFAFQPPALFFNETGGLLDIQGNDTMGASSFYNEVGATVLKTAGVGNSYLNMNFYSGGNVTNMSAGTLVFQGSGSLNGITVAKNGSVIRVASTSGGDNFDLNGEFHGISGGAIDFATYNFTFGVGTPNFQGSVGFSSGAIQFKVPITDFTLSGNAQLARTNTVSGVLNWNSGYLSGLLTVETNGTLIFSGPADKKPLQGLVILNRGTNIWLDGDINFQPASIYNHTGALFEVRCDRKIASINFTNEGIFWKSAGPGNCTNHMYFVNTGLFTNSSGTMWLTDQGVMNGYIGVAAGATNRYQSDSGSANWIMDGEFHEDMGGLVDIVGQNFTFNTGSPRLGQFLIFSGGGLHFNVPITDFTLRGNAGMYGSSFVASNGVLDWIGGQIVEAVTISPGGRLNLLAGGDKIMNYGSFLTNQGVVAIEGGDLSVRSAPGLGSIIYNDTSGVIDLRGNYNIGIGTLINHGTLRKSGGIGASDIHMKVWNTGKIEPLLGKMEFSDNSEIALSPFADLPFVIGGSSPENFSRVSSISTMTLAGGLNVVVTNAFGPEDGMRFRVLDWGKRLGGFQTPAVGYFPLGNDLLLLPVGDRSGLTLQVKNTNSAPVVVPAATNLVDRVVAVGGSTNFDVTPFVTVSGYFTNTYQWWFGGTNLLAGETNAVLTISNAQFTNAGPYCVTVTELPEDAALPVLTNFCASLEVQIPVNITNGLTSAINVVTNMGSNVTFTVAAEGSNVRYQWRRNGANIPGANSPTYTILNAQPTDGGIYNCRVQNVATKDSAYATLIVTATNTLPATDNFPGGSFAVPAFVRSGDNSNATHEAGEPRHGGLPGTNSVWIRWTAPANGVMQLNTLGSTFDTSLGVYQNTNASPAVSNLTAVVGNDDGAPYFASQVYFNALAGTNYFLAVDSPLGAQGHIVLSGVLETNVPLVPTILSQPVGTSVSLGATATLNVVAASTTNLTYQWIYNGWLALAGATNATLTLSNVNPAQAGSYSVEIVSAAGAVLESDSVTLEIGSNPSVDSFKNLPFGLNASSLVFDGRFKTFNLISAFPSVAAGTLGSQLINNFNSTTELAEPIHSDAIGGASRWYLLTALTNGTMVLDTTGSDIDTLLSVYIGTSIFDLVRIAQDDNGAPDGIRSKLSFGTLSNKTYLVAVDGKNGAQGNIYLNWRLGTPPSGAKSVPVGSGLNAGATVTLLTGATNGFPPPRYQWQFNGLNIAGATNSTYALINLSSSAAGDYSVLVSNLVGVVTDRVASVSVQSPLKLELTGQGAQLQGGVTQAVTLQRSTNLTTWTALYTNANPARPINYQDTYTPTRPNAFYKLNPWP